MWYPKGEGSTDRDTCVREGNIDNRQTDRWGSNGGEKGTETERKEKTLRQIRRNRGTERAETQRKIPELEIEERVEESDRKTKSWVGRQGGSNGAEDPRDLGNAEGMLTRTPQSPAALQTPVTSPSLTCRPLQPHLPSRVSLPCQALPVHVP